jgi:tetratricopeptide (TPR) repeat protein
MANRKRQRKGRPEISGRSDGSEATRWYRHYAALAVFCVAAAVIISLTIALLYPPEEPTEEVLAGPAIQTTPTVELPTEPQAFETQPLREELLEIGGDLWHAYPEEPHALHVVALLYCDMQKTAEAQEIWKKCIRLSPDSAGPRVGLASAAMELGEDQLAVETLEAGFESGCTTADMYHELAAAHSKLGNLEEAEQAAKNGVASYPDTARIWLQLGQVQIQLGKFAEAEENLLKAVELGTADGSVYFSLANACARLGKTEEAAEYREEFSRRKDAQSTSADEQFQVRYDAELRTIAVASMCRAATVYDRHGNPERAEQLFLRALGLEPTNGVVAGELGNFYRRLGRIADALLVQQRLVAIEPNNAAHHLNLASLSSQLGDVETAEAALKRVIAMRPNIAAGYAGLAQLYLQTGNVAQARWFAEAALRQTPTNPDEATRTYLVLAEACHQLGDEDAAERALHEARQMAAATGQTLTPATGSL